jgi:hypothetical protein
VAQKKGLRPLSNPPAVAAAAIHNPYSTAPEATLSLAHLWAHTVVLHTSQACYLGLDRLRNHTHVPVVRHHNIGILPRCGDSATRPTHQGGYLSQPRPGQEHKIGKAGAKYCYTMTYYHLRARQRLRGDGVPHPTQSWSMHKSTPTSTPSREQRLKCGHHINQPPCGGLGAPRSAQKAPPTAISQTKTALTALTGVAAQERKAGTKHGYPTAHNRRDLRMPQRPRGGISHPTQSRIRSTSNPALA